VPRCAHARARGSCARRTRVTGGVRRPHRTHMGVFRATLTPPRGPRGPGGGRAAGRTPIPGAAAAGGSAGCPGGVGRVAPACPHLGPRRQLVSRWHLRPHPDVWVASEPGTKPCPCLAGGHPSASSCRHAAAKRALLCVCVSPRQRWGPKPSASSLRGLGEGWSTAPHHPHGATSPPCSTPATQAGPPAASPWRWGGGGWGEPRHLPPTSIKPETVKLIKALQQQD